MIIKAIIYSFFNLFFYAPVGLAAAFSMPFLEKIPLLFLLGIFISLFALFLPIYVAILSAKGIEWKTANYFQKTCILLFVFPAAAFWIWIFIR